MTEKVSSGPFIRPFWHLSKSSIWVSFLVGLAGQSLLYAEPAPLWPFYGDVPLTEQECELCSDGFNDLPDAVLNHYWDEQPLYTPSYDPYVVAQEAPETDFRPEIFEESFPPPESVIPPPFSAGHSSCAYTGGLCAPEPGAEGIDRRYRDTECLRPSGESVVPPSYSRSHNSCALSGSGILRPTETKGGPGSCGIAQESRLTYLGSTDPLVGEAPIPLVEEVAQAEPVPKPAPGPLVAPAEPPQPIAETARSSRSRSVDASQRHPATLASTPRQTPAPKTVPVPQPVEEPLPAPAQERYPLFETDPKSFIAEEIYDTRNDPKAEPKANPPEPPPAAPPGYIISFQGVEMAEYVRYVSQLTGKNFIYNDDDLQFTVTIVSKEPTSLDNIMAALLQELRIHGLALVEQGNNLIIYKQAGVVSPATLLAEGAAPQEIGTRVFHITNVPADKISSVISKMVSDQALVQVLEDSNTLVVTDLANNVEKIGDLIRVLDIPSQTYVIGQYAAINSLAKDLAPLAEKILEPLAGGHIPLLVPNETTNSVFIVATSSMVKQAFSVLARLDGREGATEILTMDDLTKGGSAIPHLGAGKSIEDQRREALLEQRRQMEEAAKRAAQGGAGAGSMAKPTAHLMARKQTKFYIYKLEYRKGDQLQSALHNIAESLRLDEQENQDLITAINGVQWIESSNSLIITGSHESIGLVRELIGALDIPLRQVFLEMLILDVTIQDSLTYSVDLDERFAGPNSGNAEGFNNPITGSTSIPPLAAVLDPTTTSTTNVVTGVTTTTTTSGVNATVPFPLAVPTLGENPGFSLGIVGRKIFKDGISYQTIGALIQAVHTDTTTDIVMNPKIIVEDGYPAEIFVGTNIAYQTQVVTNDQGSVLTANVEYRDVGTTLKVTPQIGNGDMITLIIEEEVSSVTTVNTVAGTNGGSGNTSTNLLLVPQTNKNHTATRVHVPDGYFVVLSGMIRDQHVETRNQMPCLGGLPFIGGLVASQTNTINKNNIMIFIRPQIIDLDPDFDELTRRQQNIWKAKRDMKPRWKYEADTALDYLNLPRFNECHDCCWWD